MLLYLYPIRLTASSLWGRHRSRDTADDTPPARALILGNVNYGLLGNLLIGSVPGILLGALLSTSCPRSWCARESVMLAIVGCRMVLA